MSENAYLAAARAVNFGMPPIDDLGAAMERAATDHASRAALAQHLDHFLFARDRLVSKYAWAIPNERALDALARYAPLIEIGAGTGYWASLLRQRGVDIMAYDSQPPTTAEHHNRFHRNPKSVGTVWTEVLRGGPATLQQKRYAGRTLLLCWPPYDTPMAARCLDAYTGDTVLYVGEYDGCTADVRFHVQLNEEWESVDEIEIPCWRGLHDALYIYRRTLQPHP